MEFEMDKRAEDLELTQTRIEDYFPKMKSKLSSFSSIPTLPSSKLPDISIISPDTVAAILRGQLRIENFIILDARFDYEFQGGHIRGAQNAVDAESLQDILSNLPEGKSTALIFHCEFSQHRAPTLYRWLRRVDRENNLENYPKLTYPHMYVMEGGYCSFYEAFRDLCEPEGYIPMKHKEFKQERKQHSRKRMGSNGKHSKGLQFM